MDSVLIVYALLYGLHFIINAKKLILITADAYQYSPTLYTYEWCWQGDIYLNRDGGYLKCTQDSDCKWSTPCHPSGCGLIG